MNRKLIWAAAAPPCLILISAIVLLSGSTSTEPDAQPPVTTQSHPVETGPAAPLAATDVLVVNQGEPFDSLPDPPEIPTADPSTFDAEGILNAPIEELILADDRGELVVQTMTDAVPVSPLLSGISVGIRGTGEPMALAELDVDSLLHDSHEDESDPDDTPEESTVGTVPADSDDDSDGAKKDDDEKDDDNHVRITVALIEPKGDAVKPLDEVIVRSRTKGLKRAFVLVRARQKDAPWWVQEEAIRNGYYFRSRAQFGNAKTLDGTRFRMVIAFTGEDDEVPEAGVFFHDIPLSYTLSQEFDVIVDKD